MVSLGIGFGVVHRRCRSRAIPTPLAAVTVIVVVILGVRSTLVVPRVLASVLILAFCSLRFTGVGCDSGGGRLNWRQR